MAVSSPRAAAEAYDTPPTDHPNEAEHRRMLADGVRGALEGKLNVVGTLTLTISVASTTFSNPRISANTIVILVPTTANASAEIGNGTIYQTYPNATEGQAVINHANNAQADRTFVYALFG